MQILFILKYCKISLKYKIPQYTMTLMNIEDCYIRYSNTI